MGTPFLHQATRGAASTVSPMWRTGRQPLLFVSILGVTVVCSALVAALYYHIVGWLGMLAHAARLAGGRTNCGGARSDRSAARSAARSLASSVSSRLSSRLFGAPAAPCTALAVGGSDESEAAAGATGGGAEAGSRDEMSATIVRTASRIVACLCAYVAGIAVFVAGKVTRTEVAVWLGNLALYAAANACIAFTCTWIEGHVGRAKAGGRASGRRPLSCTEKGVLGMGFSPGTHQPSDVHVAGGDASTTPGSSTPAASARLALAASPDDRSARSSNPTGEPDSPSGTVSVLRASI